MIGVYIEGAEDISFDNELVYKNALFDGSQLKKKHQAICFNPSR